MWFIKVEYWDEFQKLIDNYISENNDVRKIKVIKIAEDFCKQGKGVSFWKATMNNKVMKEIEKCLNDKKYYEYKLKD